MGVLSLLSLPLVTRIMPPPRLAHSARRTDRRSSAPVPALRLLLLSFALLVPPSSGAASTHTSSSASPPPLLLSPKQHAHHRRTLLAASTASSTSTRTMLRAEPRDDFTGFHERTLDQVDRAEGIDNAAPFGQLDQGSPTTPGDGLGVGQTHADKLGAKFYNKPTLTRKGHLPKKITYECNHHDSCGTRTNRGPQSTDSLNDGVNCVCRGLKEHGYEMYCFPGKCYDPDTGSEHREDFELDEGGLCEFTEERQVDVEQCRRKFFEAKDESLQFFTDPPALPHMGHDPILQR